MLSSWEYSYYHSLYGHMFISSITIKMGLIQERHTGVNNRISALLDALLSHILCFLPTKYPARTTLILLLLRNLWIVYFTSVTQLTSESSFLAFLLKNLNCPVLRVGFALPLNAMLLNLIFTLVGIRTMFLSCLEVFSFAKHYKFGSCGRSLLPTSYINVFPKSQDP